jgi:uncharacterized protein (DUF4415 family)
MTTAKKRNKNITPISDLVPKSAEDDEVPPLDETFWANAQMGSPLKKRLLSLRLDNDVIDWFKEQGPSYQTRMNQVLRTYVDFSKREALRKK